MTLLLSDPRVSAVPVLDVDEPLVALDRGFGPEAALVRRELATRLEWARAALPPDVFLRVVEGYRPAYRQQAIIERYSAEIRAERPGIGAAELRVLTSRFVAPLDVAPHVAGAAVDVTLVDSRGTELDLGTPVDATPERSGGRCYFAADDIGAEARANRDLLARVLGRAGLVNYPTEWWHYSYGDRYWALATGAGAALYGPMLEAPARAGTGLSGNELGDNELGDNGLSDNGLSGTRSGGTRSGGTRSGGGLGGHG